MTESLTPYINPFEQFFRDALRAVLPDILNTVSDAKRPQTSTPAAKNKLAVSADEAAEMMSISRTTLDRLRKRGLIHPVKATRIPTYALTEIQRYLNEASQPIDP